MADWRRRAERASGETAAPSAAADAAASADAAAAALAAARSLTASHARAAASAACRLSSTDLYHTRCTRSAVHLGEGARCGSAPCAAWCPPQPGERACARAQRAEAEHPYIGRAAAGEDEHATRPRDADDELAGPRARLDLFN